MDLRGLESLLNHYKLKKEAREREGNFVETMERIREGGE